MQMMQNNLSTTPAPVFLPRKTCWVVGVDLGQSSDPTAVAVLEHVTGVMDEGSDRDRHCGLTEHLQTPAERVDVRHLERLPLGLSYPVVVQHVRDMLARPPLCGDENQRPAELVIDETGVGRAAGDIFAAAGLRPKRVSITAGSETAWAGVKSEAGTMKDELLDFRRKLSDTGRATYAARTGAHDDLVLAVAIACWWISRPQSQGGGVGIYGTVLMQAEGD